MLVYPLLMLLTLRVASRLKVPALHDFASGCATCGGMALDVSRASEYLGGGYGGSRFGVDFMDSQITQQHGPKMR